MIFEILKGNVLSKPKLNSEEMNRLNQQLFRIPTYNW